MTFSFGPGMKTPKDIFDLLKFNDFKKELLRFFITEHHNDEYAVILGDKVLYCSVDNECKKFSTINGLIKVKNVPGLYGDQLEAWHFMLSKELKQTQEILLLVLKTRT